MATITGTAGNDALVGTTADDTIDALDGNDTISGLGGNDRITGGNGADTANLDISQDGSDRTNLDAGSDLVSVSAAAPGQIRLGFAPMGIGNGDPFAPRILSDRAALFSGTFVPTLPVRLQAEAGDDTLTGPLSSFDDEGITFVSVSPGVTFDVRESIRFNDQGFLFYRQFGDQFKVVTFGSSGNDVLSALQPAQPTYIDGGAGDDTLTGGTANDGLAGGTGNDTANINVSTDGADTIDLGDGSDVVNVSAAAAGQVRLSFTSAQVGDGNALANQDGGLAVRFQAEDRTGTPIGPLSRYDDEGITFVSATAGLTFDVRDLVAGTQRGDLFEVVALGSSENDTLTAGQSARSSYFDGGRGNDTLSGGLGNDSFVGGAGNDTIDGGAGTDRAIFTFGLRAATAGVSANGAATLTSPDGTDTFRGIEQFVFSDRTIDNADGSPLVDDLFYLSRNPDVAAAGVDADTHYFQSGAREGRDPNAFFSTTGYLAANPDVRAAGVNPLTHYDQIGFREGRDPGANFDNELYLLRNPDVAAAGFDPLVHFLQFGQAEGRTIGPAIGRAGDIRSGFDAEYYLLSNVDVSRAAIAAGGDAAAFARQHFDAFGVREGRDPNAVFDTDGYRNAYRDVAAEFANPLDHYMTFGFREGRDPSAGFDTSAYLANYTDVAAAGINPMQHYLQAGIYEGRSAFGDGSFGGGNVG